MGDILKFSRRRSDREEEIFDQSSLWIAKLSRGLTPEETEQLRTWLRDQRRREVLFKMAEIWDKMDTLQGLADIFPIPEPKADAWESTGVESCRSPKGRSISKRVCASTYALSVSVAALVMVAVLSIAFLGSETSGNTFSKTFITAKGETSSFYLNDGSHLVLNTNGRLHVRYSNQERLLLLEQGELSINVAHDMSRPLSVISGGRVVQAVGTAFNVNLRDNQVVEIIVTEGTVRVKDVSMTDRDRPVGRLPESAMTITRGEKVTLGRINEIATKMEEVDIAVALGWRQGNLIFRGETLEQALTEVSRYTDIEFEIADSDIRNKQIAGLFKIGDIQGLLSTLDKNFQISSEQVDDKKIVLRAD
jgi:transmembrane sensor